MRYAARSRVYTAAFTPSRRHTRVSSREREAARQPRVIDQRRKRGKHRRPVFKKVKPRQKGSSASYKAKPCFCSSPRLMNGQARRREREMRRGTIVGRRPTETHRFLSDRPVAPFPRADLVAEFREFPRISPFPEGSLKAPETSSTDGRAFSAKRGRREDRRERTFTPVIARHADRAALALSIFRVMLLHFFLSILRSTCSSVLDRGSKKK